jgi:hypothetical protein
MAIYMWREHVPRTFTISWEEKSDMSSWWTYSDDAAWLTAWSWDFDDFFWYSEVLLNISWVETSGIIQRWWVFTSVVGAMGNITSWDNVMIKFPVRWIKMTKSWSIVTLSITDWLGRENEWYQYYAHCTWTLSNPWTPKDQFYLWAYKAYINSNVLKSWSWKTPTASLRQSHSTTYAKANGSWYNIMGFYQNQYVNALYMMKYGNPNAQSVVWQWYTWWSSARSTWWTNSQTSATYWTTSSTVQVKLFWLEDRWGNLSEYVWWVYTTSSKELYVTLNNWSWDISWWEWTWITVGTTQSDGGCLSSIVGDNKAMFAPLATESSIWYYSDRVRVYASRLADTWAYYSRGVYWWPFGLFFSNSYTSANSTVGNRIMFIK